MNTNANQERTDLTKWAHALAWLTLFALTAVPFAWGDDYRYGKPGDRYQTDRGNLTEMDAMRQLMDYEAAAVELARAGDDKTRHGEMRDYLKELDGRATERINQLHQMMDRYYGIHYEPRISETYAQRVRDLRNPAVRGDEFEIRLLKYTIEQHQQEVSAMQPYLQWLTRQDMAGMVNHVIDRRQGDARKLQSWLKQWYDISYTSQYDRYSQRGGSDRRSEGRREYYKYR